MSHDERPRSGYSAWVLGVLFLIYVFNFIDRQVLAILIGPIQQDLGVSDTVMGLLGGFAFALFYTVAGIPIAAWADRGSRRNVIAFSLTLWSAMTAVTGLARNVWHLALTRILVGVGEAGGSPPSHSMISDYFPPERRATALALYANGVYVGSGLAYMFGGWVVTHFDWRTTYFAVGLMGLPLVALLLLTVREPARGTWDATPVADAAPLRDVVRFLLGRRSFVWLVTAACFQSIAGYGILMWGGEFLARVHGMSRLEIGAWLGPTILFGGCFGVSVGGWLSDRLGRRDVAWYLRLPALSAVLGLPLGTGFVLLDDPTAALISFAAYYVVANCYIGPLWSIPQNLVRPEMRATTSAILLFILNIVGLGFGPFVVGALNDALAATHGELAIRWSMLVVVLTGGVAAVFYQRGMEPLRREMP